MNREQKSIANSLTAQLAIKLLELTGEDYDVFIFPRMLPKIPIDVMLQVVAEALDMCMEDYASRSRKEPVIDLKRVAVLLLKQYSPLATRNRMAARFKTDYTSIKHMQDRGQELLDCRDEILMPKYLKAKTAINQWVHQQSK